MGKGLPDQIALKWIDPEEKVIEIEQQKIELEDDKVLKLKEGFFRNKFIQRSGRTKILSCL